MASTVNQPNMNPTNKLGAATAAAGLMAVLLWVLEAFSPNTPNAELVAGLTPLAVFLAGWLIPDAPNVPEVRE